MPIEIRQPGAAKAAAQAGTIIGKGKRAEKEQVIAEQRRQQQVNIEARRASEKRAMDWELQKMEMRSQQEFQQELAEKQWDYERFNRAKAWEIEKMEMASRMDFQREEQDRQTKLSRIDTQEAALQKEISEGRALPPEKDPKIESLLFSLKQQRIATEIGTKVPFGKQPTPPSVSKQLSEVRAAEELSAYSPDELKEFGLDPTKFPAVQGEETIEPEAQEGTVLIRRKDTGEIRPIAQEDVERALATGNYETADTPQSDVFKPVSLMSLIKNKAFTRPFPMGIR